MILDFKGFAKYKYDILRNKTSGISFNPKNLILSNENINSKLQSENLSFIEFNNYDIDERTLEFLHKNKSELNKISHLSFWNSKLIDLSLLQYFKKVEFLNISHISDSNFTFNGLDNLENLKTLCLLKTGKIKSFNSIISNQTIENISIIQPTNLKTTHGIGNLKKLKYLNIEGSIDKSYNIDSLNELDTLTHIKKIKLHKIKVPFKELITALKPLGNLELDIDTNLYELEQYKELSKELTNVKSLVFNPYIERKDSIQPIGKGKRIIKKTDKKLDEKINMLKIEWNK